ncbi:hypothetical protein [Sorangium sp. So ce1024]|uniref:hypothetical protein n=1 Tax=Sorangium sp. So ce1024 TaxID=3133327 RepID=UPI003EFC34F3
MVNILAAKDISTKSDTLGIKALSQILMMTNELSIRSTGNTAINTSGATKINSRGGMHIHAGPELNGDASKVSFKGRSRAALEVGAWHTIVGKEQVMVGGPGSNCTFTGNSAVLKCGSELTCNKSSVTVKASTVDLKGTGAVRLNGARIDLG